MISRKKHRSGTGQVKPAARPPPNGYACGGYAGASREIPHIRNYYFLFNPPPVACFLGCELNKLVAST